MKWTGEEDSLWVALFRHGFYVKNKHGFRDAVVGRKGDGFAETGTAVLVVVLCLGEVPLGCVWEGRKRRLQGQVRGCGKKKL